MDTSSSSNARTETVRRAILRSGLRPDSERPCPYLPTQLARNIAFRASSMSPGIYHSLMNLNFRRSGSFFYEPACPSCRQCQAIRVVVDAFTPDRAQQRCWRRNRDVSIEAGTPRATEEKHQLFRDYLARRHGPEMEGSWEAFTDFLYQSPVETVEVEYRLAGRLIAVGINDIEPEAASTVYCYFDPQYAQRSPGIFNVLWSIDDCRRRRLNHLYLGYYIRDCRKMNYKTVFRPSEILTSDGRWRVAGC